MKKEIKFENLHPADLQHIIENESIAYLPLGSLEWHERHLPFGVDAIIAYEIGIKSVKSTGGTVLPPLYIGTDTIYNEGGKEYRGMNIQAKRVLEGSIYPLKREVFKEVVLQILQNLQRQGFKNVVVIAGHCEPEQLKVLNEVTANNSLDMKIIQFPNETTFFEGSLDHAGEIETRLIMYLRPKLVQLNKLSKPYTAIVGGDPHKATRKEGKKQFEAIVRQLISIVQKEKI